MTPTRLSPAFASLAPAAPDAGGTMADLGALPEWDLTDLYPAPDAPELARDLERAEEQAKAIAERWRGRLGGIDGAELGEAVAAYERLDEILARVMSYAGLVHAGNMQDPEIGRFYQDMQERVTAISTHTLFFALELNQIDDGVLEAQLTAPEAARYRPWIEASRQWRPHQLDEEMERLLHEKHVVGRSAWVRLFDETMAALRFPLDGRDLTSAEALHLLSDRDRSVRRKAAKSLAHVLETNSRLFAQITNTLAKDKEIEDRWRKHARPVSSRNLANQVEDDVVDALVEAVREAYPRLSHRYYAMKARWLGDDTLDWWDRNAPLPDADERTIPWQEARETVLSAYAAFSPRLAEVGARFFDQPWIDAPARPGKAPGAFAHPTVPSVHPYLLLNYQGKTRDVMTLAHELGHGVHQVLAGAQGHFLSDTPLTLAETASVFGEMLTFRRLLDAETDPTRRRIMLAAKVEDMLNTVVRQIAMFEFELKVHEGRRKGELTADTIGGFWMETQRASLGPAVRFDERYRHFWSYVPHFVHAPFYVYAYAFGDCLVNSLYAVYENGEEGFQDRYLDMLAAGGSKRHGELLAPFGLDASDPGFWRRGLGLIERFVDELEAADREAQ